MSTTKAQLLPFLVGSLLLFIHLHAQDATRNQPERVKLAENVEASRIINQLPPAYPPIATQAGIQGPVVLHAIIGVDGNVKQLDVVSGHPLLVPAALDGVRRWRYKPILINGKAAEVDTTITVTFSLSDANVMRDSSYYRKQEAQTLAAVDPTTADNIRKLINLTGAQDTIHRMVDSGLVGARNMAISGLPAGPDRDRRADAYVSKLRERVERESVDLVVPVYARHFSDEEIKAIVTFFESPAGRRFVQESPSYVQEIQTVSSDHWRNVLTLEIMKELPTEFPDFGKGMPVAPNPPPAPPMPIGAPSPASQK
jgi:TonB family protein